jgi:antitoxin component of MazEF toxin-antitoxin module
MKNDGPTVAGGTSMVKTLQKYGNSYALIIDKAILDATGITPETQLKVTVLGDSLTITPSNVGLGRERVDEIMSRVERDYGKALKKLSE